MGTTAEVHFTKHLVNLQRHECDSGHVAGAGGCEHVVSDKGEKYNPAFFGGNSPKKKAGCFMNDFNSVSGICLMRTVESFSLT